MRRKYILLGLVILAIIWNLAIAVNVKAQEKIQIGTAPQGGTFYAIGAGIAEILNKWGGFKATAQATGGGVQNCRLIDSGEIIMACAGAQQPVQAYRGEKPFTKKIDLRIGFFMSEAPHQFVVLDESPIRSFYDLKGKKVAVGAMGSGVEAKTKIILEAYGLRYDDITTRFIGMSEATEALKDGMVDAAAVMGSIPTACITEISLLRKVRILPVEDEIKNKIIKNYPFMIPTTIPPNTYKNQPNEIRILCDMEVILFSPKMTDDIAYRITKTFFEHLDYLATIHKSAERVNVKKACAFDIGVPYHSGAIKYFKEAGVWGK